MSTFTSFWLLELPNRGEFPGTWDSPLNANFTKIDLLLQNLHNSRSSNDTPTTNNVSGSTWYDLSTELLKIFSGGVYIPVVSHTHDGTIEGVPKVNVATDMFYDVDTRLPWAAIEEVAINASTLGGVPLTGLPDAIAGAGLAGNGPLLDLADIGTAGEYIKVTIDDKGRVVSGVNPTTIGGFGITNVYTKTETQENFASINGLGTQLFRVEGPDDVVPNPLGLALSDCAVSRGYAELNFASAGHLHAELADGDHSHATDYHPKNGSSLEILAVANPAGDTDAMPRSYADTRYKTPFDTHVGTTHIFADGSNPMTQELTLSSNTPAGNESAASKLYVINEAGAQIATALTGVALLGGSATQTFLVDKAPTAVADPVNWTKYALNIERANELYSDTGHTHPGVADAAIDDLQSQIDLLSGTSDPSAYVTERQGIQQCSLDASGNPDFLSYSGLDVTVLGASTPFYANIAAGFKSDGTERNLLIAIPADDIITTVPSADNTYKIGLSEQEYNITYDVELAALINDTDIDVIQGSHPFSEDEIPTTGYVTFAGDATVYTYDASADTSSDGYIVITFPVNGLQQALSGGEVATFWEDAGATINATATVLEDTAATGTISYNKVAPGAPSTDDYWFDREVSSFRRYNGATWGLRPTIFFGEVVVSGAAITGVTPYQIGTHLPAAADLVATTVTATTVTATGTVTGGTVTTTGESVGPKFKVTAEGGYAILLTNQTGVNSVKGSLVSADTVNDDSVVLTAAGSKTCFGVMYSDGVANGSDVWVVIAGIAELLLENSTLSAAGNWVIPSATVAGRADATATTVPGSTLAEHETHFGEIGHCIQTQIAGTDVLARTVIHFN